MSELQKIKSGIGYEFNALFSLAFRDLIKFLRNRARVFLHVGLPIALVWIIGSGFELNIGSAAENGLDFNYLKFVFAGVIGQNAFQSAAVGVISFIEERKSGFSQTIFVAPVSRFTIVFGKLFGETLVALSQLVVILAFRPLLGVDDFTKWDYLVSILITVICALLGGAFGVLVLANIRDLKTASQIAPILVGTQFFLSGVLQPIKNLPGPQLVLSRLMPMTYAVDFSRGVIYFSSEEYDKVILYDPWISLTIIILMFITFFGVGTWMFIRSERNK